MKKLLLSILFIIAQISVFAQSGNGWDWSSTSGVATYAPGRIVNNIATDASGNVYAVGKFQGTLTLGNLSVSTSGDGTNNYNFDEDGFVVKYNAAGIPQWLKRVGKTAVGANEGASFVKLDANGNVYVGLSDGGINTTGLNFLVKFDNNGNELWSKLNYSISALNVNANGVFVTGNDKLSKFDFAGNEIWSINNAGAGASDNFVDNLGNSYLIKSGTTNFLGENFTVTGLASSYIGKVDGSGAVQWKQEIKGRSTAYFTVDKSGKSYIWLTGGFGDVFQGISTNNISGYSYFELSNTGAISRYLKIVPYKGAFKVRDDGIYGYALEIGYAAAKSVAYGDYFVNLPTDNTLALGIILKYNISTDAVEKVNTFEIKGAANNPGKINTVETAVGGKVLVGGTYGTFTKFGATTNTIISSSGNAPTDLFLAQYDLSLIPAPATTTWTGTANDGNWNNAANWNNGIPDGTKKTILPAGLGSNYPITIPANASPAKLEIATGAKIQLPLNFSAPFGIVNNGTIEITEAGAFTGTFNATAPVAPTGSGKIVIKNAGLAFYFSGPINQSIELDFTGKAATYGGTINGDLILTKGILDFSIDLYPLVVNNVVGGSATSYVAGKLTRKVIGNGNYNYPVGTTDRYAPVNLQLNNIVGPQNIAVSFTKTINGSAPNTTAGGKTVTTLLNTGIWTVAPDISLSSGNYGITLAGTGYSNGVADANNYVVLKRNNSSSAWGFYSDNGAATQNVGIVTATAGNITGFSDFAIGIASGSVPATLPVKLIDFSAKANGQSVQLNWETASELNNDKFIIERSADGNHFVQLAEVKGKGMASFYNYHDAAPVNGYNYYRLKQVDFDGTATNSEVKTVKFTLTEEMVKIYPNPVISSFHITRNGNEIVTLSLVDFTGKKILNITKPEVEVVLPTPIINGIYILYLKYKDGTMSSHKLVVKRNTSY